jgi:ubiquinone/menaquinone biosynthesis C-methylase UbiE
MTSTHFGEAYGANPAANYERFFVPAIGAPVATDLIRRAALQPGERVLDVACGTGIVARQAAQQVGPTGTVVGLDINPGMMEVARSVTPPGVRIEWREASAADMPFPDASFDVALCQMGLEFMPDKDAALREMRRVLAPGGRLIFNVPGPTPRPFTIMEAAFARHIGAEPVSFVNQVFSLNDTAEIQGLVSDAGFHDVSVQAADMTLRLPEDFFRQYVYSTPLAGAVAQAGAEQRAALERDVTAQWQEFMEDGVLVIPVRMVVATARK